MRCLLDKVKVNNLHYCHSPLERAFVVATPVVRLKLRQTKPEGMSKTHRRTVIQSHSFKILAPYRRANFCFSAISFLIAAYNIN